MTKIDSFKGTYNWLSNFYLCEIEFEGEKYPSTEHAYQAAKTLNPIERRMIREANSFAEAKRLGSKITLRHDWTKSKRLSVMFDLLIQKFDPDNNPELASKLLETKDAELIEGNNWGDVFWGICNNKGSNYLGKTLMFIRDQILRKESE